MRYRRVRVSGELLVALITEGNEVHTICDKGLPPGTKFSYATVDPIFGFSMVVEHESFDELKPYDLIPEHPRPEMRKL